jgi:hypothetical protein
MRASPKICMSVLMVCASRRSVALGNAPRNSTGALVRMGRWFEDGTIIRHALGAPTAALLLSAATRTAGALVAHVPMAHMALSTSRRVKAVHATSPNVAVPLAPWVSARHARQGNCSERKKTRLAALACTALHRSAATRRARCLASIKHARTAPWPVTNTMAPHAGMANAISMTAATARVALRSQSRAANVNLATQQPTVGRSVLHVTKVNAAKSLAAWVSRAPALQA